jgi:ribosomal protein L1
MLINVRTTVILTWWKNIAVLTNEENFEEATNAGADTVGNDELIEKINQGNIDLIY